MNHSNTSHLLSTVKTSVPREDSENLSLRELNQLSQRSKAELKQIETEEIKFDYEEFMRLYQISKNVKSNFKADVTRRVSPKKEIDEKPKVIPKKEFFCKMQEPTKEQRRLQEISTKKMLSSVYNKQIIDERKRLKR